MAKIDEWTLTLSIQAVAAEIRRQRAVLTEHTGEAEDYQTLEDWERAAQDLENAYTVASRQVLNLPAYDDLIAG